MTQPTWREEGLKPRVNTEQGDVSREPGLARGGGRENRPVQTLRDDSQYETEQNNTRSILRLPSALAPHWQIERELESRGAEADLLVVIDHAGERRVAKIYRAGIQPKTEVLLQLGGTSFEHIVRLFDHGRSDGRWYELLEYVEGGSLEDLIRREGPKLDEARVGQILVELLKAIEHLHANNVVHRDIKPSNVLVRSLTPFDLVLTDFGIASMLGDGSRRFTTGNRTIAYAAPEAAIGEVSKASDWWSLGIMLLEMLTGRHPFAGARPGELVDDRAIMSRLAQMPVDQLAEGVAEPWRVLCRGLLRREAKNRWTDAEIVRWIRRDPRLVVVDEAPPTSHALAPFFFAGNRYGDFSEIAHAFAENWVEARRTIERGHFLNWVKDDLKDNEWRQFLTDLDRDCDDLDERVFRIITKLNPTAIPKFCGHSLAPDGLSALCRDAASGKSDAKSTVIKLFQSQILLVAAQSTGMPQFRELNEGVIALNREYLHLREGLKKAGAPVSAIPSDTPYADLLMVLLPDGAAFLSQIREQAAKVNSADARDCPWFRELSNASKTSIAALLLMPPVASEAEAETRERREREEAEARERRRRDEELRNQQEYDNAYQLFSIASGSSIGLMGGLVVGFVPCWIFTGIVGWFSTSSTAWGWYTFLMLGFAIVGIGVGNKIAHERRWVASATKNVSDTRTAGIGLTAGGLILSCLLVGYWINLASNDTPAGRLAAQEQQRRENTRYNQLESQRISSLVNSAQVGTSIGANGQLIGSSTRLFRPAQVIAFFSYSGARANSDVAVIKMEGSGRQFNCTPFTLTYATGNVYCTFNNVPSGGYRASLYVNGIFTRSVWVEISS